MEESTLDGGSAWESNPAPPRWRGATDFEDREGHRAPFASRLERSDRERTVVDRIGNVSTVAAAEPRSDVLFFDETHVAGSRALLRVFGCEIDPLPLTQELEYRAADRATVEKVLNTTLVADKPESFVN